MRLADGKTLALGAFLRFRDDRLTTTASSVAFYAMLAVVPAIAAVVSTYSVVADPHDITRLAASLKELLPPPAAKVLDEQIRQGLLSNATDGRSLAGSVGWFLLLLWSASRAIRSFVTALALIYDRAERRPMWQRYAVSLVLTVGGVVFLSLATFVILVLPSLLGIFAAEDVVAAVRLARWPILFLVAALAIATLYRFGPNRKNPDWPHILLGSAVGTLLWLGFALAFSWYIGRFGGYTRLYGSLGGIVAFMFWLWGSALAVLIGAEVDAAVGRRRAGEPQARGSRGEEARGAPEKEATPA